MDQNNKENITADVFVKLAAIVYSILSIIALLWIYFRERINLPHVYIWGSTPLVQQTFSGVLFAVIFIVISICARHIFRCVRDGEYELKQILGNLSVGQIVILAVLSSAGEELFFRGAMQPSLGLWQTSIIFGILHWPPTRNLFFYPVVATITGFGLGWIFIQNGKGLCAPIIAHFLINMVGLYRITHLASAGKPDSSTNITIGEEEADVEAQ